MRIVVVSDIHSNLLALDAVLAKVGAVDAIWHLGDVVGYGIDRPDFWIGPLTTTQEFREVHVAFAAPDRASVHAFFDAAVGAGAEVLHHPRLGPEYHPSYNGGFVRDPDGNNVEAVSHGPE